MPNTYLGHKVEKVSFVCDRCKSTDVIQTWLTGELAIFECSKCGNKGRNKRLDHPH